MCQSLLRELRESLKSYTKCPCILLLVSDSSRSPLPSIARRRAVRGRLGPQLAVQKLHELLRAQVPCLCTRRLKRPHSRCIMCHIATNGTVWGKLRLHIDEKLHATNKEMHALLLVACLTSSKKISGEGVLIEVFDHDEQH